MTRPIAVYPADRVRRILRAHKRDGSHDALAIHILFEMNAACDQAVMEDRDRRRDVACAGSREGVAL